MCKFEENVEVMTFENCNLFRRSFTTVGMGYTFNNEVEEKLVKEDFRNAELSPNTAREPSYMKSTGSDSFLTVVIENNAEEVERYKNRKILSGKLEKKEAAHKPNEITVSLHNPKEPADTKFVPSTSIRIPLGQSTTFFITPKAREIDDSGKELTEIQRSCRLNENTEALSMFNVYTRTACLMECKIKYSMKKCGCSPWYFPINMTDKVNIFCFHNP